MRSALSLHLLEFFQVWEQSSHVHLGVFTAVVCSVLAGTLTHPATLISTVAG